MSQWIECTTEIKVVNEEILKGAVELAGKILAQENAKLGCVYGNTRNFNEIGVSVKAGKLVFSRNDVQSAKDVERTIGVVKSTYQATLIRSQLSKSGLRTGRNFGVKDVVRSHGAWRIKAVAR